MGTRTDENEMSISGHTTPYAVLGHPIGHTLSPAMHNAAMRSLGMDAIYLAFDVHPDRLMDVLPAMRDMGFGGVNLTVPLKEVAFRGLEELDTAAAHLGAVNTIEFLDDGRIKGHNTDGYGFLQSLNEAFGETVKGRSVFMLGSGGAGRAVAITCAAEGAAQVVLSDMDADRARRVADEIAGLFPAVKAEAAPAQPEAWPAACAAAGLVVQATPVGMKPEDSSLLGPEAFRAGQVVLDLVYMYPETDLMRTARSAGARALNGLGMLLHQGARAFTVWTGREAAVDVMRGVLEGAVYGKQA
jgi:shikimate dehydrogenase